MRFALTTIHSFVILNQAEPFHAVMEAHRLALRVHPQGCPADVRGALRASPARRALVERFDIEPFPDFSAK